MTASFGSEAMRALGEGGFIDGFQDELQDGHQQFIPKSRDTKRTLFAVWSAKRSPSPPPIQNRACELLRTRLLSVWSHLIEIPSCSNFRIRSLITAISASHSSWEYPSGSSLSDFFPCFLGAFFSIIVFVSFECRSSWQWRCRRMRLLNVLLLWLWSM